MKKKLKLAFEELEREMEVIPREFMHSLQGGANTSDISSIGFIGGMTVQDYGSSVGITANGKTVTGENIMMLIPGTAGNHAVVVTGTTMINGIRHLTYFDPTLNRHSSIPNGDAVGFYGVSKIQPNVPNY